MKALLEFIWLFIFLSSAYLAIQGTFYLLDEHGLVLSILAGLVAFFVLVATMGSVVLYFTDRIRPADSTGIFTSDAQGIRYESQSKTVTFLWDDIQKIKIISNDKGPAEEDTFWQFYNSNQQHIITIPQGPKNDKTIRKAVMSRFHSCDELNIDLALSCISNKQFLVWQSMDYDGMDTEIRDPAAQEKEGRPIVENQWIGWLLIFLAAISYGGYFLLSKMNPEANVWHSLSANSVEFFSLTLISIMAVYLFSAYDLKQFQKKYPTINGTEALDALKPLVRRCMWVALFTIVLIVLCFGFLAMIADYHGGKTTFIAALVLTAVSVVFSQWYDPQEKAFKQIPCEDETLEEQVQAIFNSWQKDMFPKF